MEKNPKTVKLLKDFASFHYQQNKANFLQLSASRYKALVWITFFESYYDCPQAEQVQ